jgi:hypothetical protein
VLQPAGALTRLDAIMYSGKNTGQARGNFLLQRRFETKVSISPDYGK